ncbi:hypothetical protein D3C75_1214450 [compost metagenome]
MMTGEEAGDPILADWVMGFEPHAPKTDNSPPATSTIPIRFHAFFIIHSPILLLKPGYDGIQPVCHEQNAHYNQHTAGSNFDCSHVTVYTAEAS